MGFALITDFIPTEWLWGATLVALIAAVAPQFSLESRDRDFLWRGCLTFFGISIAARPDGRLIEVSAGNKWPLFTSWRRIVAFDAEELSALHPLKSSHQTVLQRPSHSRRAAVDAEFGEEIARVRAGGVNADLETVRDFFGSEAFDEEG